MYKLTWEQIFELWQDGYIQCMLDQEVHGKFEPTPENFADTIQVQGNPVPAHVYKHIAKYLTKED